VSALVISFKSASHVVLPCIIMQRCLLQVRDAGMHVGIALKPSTPVEHVFPYVEAGDIDLVSRNPSESHSTCTCTRTCLASAHLLRFAASLESGRHPMCEIRGAHLG